MKLVNTLYNLEFDLMENQMWNVTRYLKKCSNI